MAKADLSVIGVNGGNRPFRVAASATRGYAGEPMIWPGTLSSGIASVNTITVMPDARPVVGTDNLVGISSKDMAVNSAGTVTAQTVYVTTLIPQATRVRGKAKTAASVDTDSELLGLLWDVVLFDLTSSVYTIDETGAADTSGLIIVDGDITKGTLDVVVDVRSFRADVS